MIGARVRRLDWSRRALDAYVSTLIHIGSENRTAAYLVEQRVDHVLKLLLMHPRLGTSGPQRNERIFAIPNTGHVFHYRVFADSIRVTHWSRARQRMRR